MADESDESAVTVRFGGDVTGVDPSVAVAKAKLQLFNAEIRTLAKEAAAARNAANDNLVNFLNSHKSHNSQLAQSIRRHVVLAAANYAPFELPRGFDSCAAIVTSFDEDEAGPLAKDRQAERAEEEVTATSSGDGRDAVELKAAVLTGGADRAELARNAQRFSEVEVITFEDAERILAEQFEGLCSPRDPASSGPNVDKGPASRRPRVKN